jgi:predicted ATP-grasp superfamily ATP-dependent carboligase
MNKKQKEIINKIKELVKQLDAAIQEDTGEQVLNSSESNSANGNSESNSANGSSGSNWTNGQPNERPKKG